MFINVMKFVAVIVTFVSLGACTVASGGNFNIASGPAPTNNATPYDAALVCYADKIADKTPVYIAVGNIKDYTGKYSYEAAEGGYKVTQGGALMVMGALGQLGSSVRQVERFDTAISDIELSLSGKGLLGVNKEGKRSLRRPLRGTVTGSDYYIAGGITEVNYNIQSGGAEARIANIGGGARYYVMNIAVDLRLVDTVTLEVVKTVSLQKQVVGREIIAGTFRFFSNTLVDINVGSKNQEPIQLGVRSTLQAATLDLISSGAFSDVDATSCSASATDNYNHGILVSNQDPSKSIK